MTTPISSIRVQVRDAIDILFDRLHPLAEGGIEAILRAVVTDIKAAAGGV